jgi:hypothetical protein
VLGGDGDITLCLPKYCLKIQFSPLREQSARIARISWLMMFRKIVTIYSESHRKLINTLHGQSSELLIVKSGGT